MAKKETTSKNYPTSTQNPNYPSTTGKKSGKNRGNKKK